MVRKLAKKNVRIFLQDYGYDIHLVEITKSDDEIVFKLNADGEVVFSTETQSIIRSDYSEQLNTDLLGYILGELF
jgi:hypothetical protein